MTRPAGSASVKATWLRPEMLPAGLWTLNVIVVVPLSGMLAAPKDLVIVGGAFQLKDTDGG
jgi:hypothetical protein